MHPQHPDMPHALRRSNWELGAALEVLRSTARELSALRVRGVSDELFALAQARHSAARCLLERIHRALGNEADASWKGQLG